MISSFVSLWKTITSSIRFRSSGLKTFFSSPMIRSFMSSYERPVSSPTEKPSVWFFEIVEAPMFEVMITIVLRKSTLRPGASVRLGDGDDRLLLADDALVELVLHPDQLLRLGLGQLEHRDAGPHRDDVGDLLLADRRALGALGLAGLPLLLELALLVRQAPLLVAEVGGLLELLRLDRGLLGAPRLLDLLLEVAVDRWLRHRLDAHARSGIVDEIDGLVRQKAVGDVAVRQLRGRLQRLVGDVDLVVGLVAVAQALEDLHGLLDRRLVDRDLLEAALQRGVALQVLAVLVERRRADRLQLAAGERRL